MNDEAKRKILKRVFKGEHVVLSQKQAAEFDGLCAMDDATNMQSPDGGEVLLTLLTPAGKKFIE